MEELKPKLGIYELMIDCAEKIAENLFESCGKKEKRISIIYREIVNNFAKPFEILEYSGFITMRDASKGMKSRGRGRRYALNLCILLENISGTRLTNERFQHWLEERDEAVEFHRKSFFYEIDQPKNVDVKDLGIFKLPIEKIKKSKAYPYGLTTQMYEVLNEAGYKTVGDLAEVSDQDLERLSNIGEKKIKRIRNIVAQAIWM